MGWQPEINIVVLLEKRSAAAFGRTRFPGLGAPYFAFVFFFREGHLAIERTGNLLGVKDALLLKGNLNNPIFTLLPVTGKSSTSLEHANALNIIGQDMADAG